MMSTKYTIDNYEISKSGLDWIIKVYRDTKSKKTGETDTKWVHTGTYHRTLGEALAKVYELMLAEGKSCKDVKSLATKVTNNYKRLMELGDPK